MTPGPLRCDDSETEIDEHVARKGYVMRAARKLAITVSLAVPLVGGGYVAAGATVYDRLTHIDSTCEADRAANSPAAFTVGDVGTTTVATAIYAMPDYESVAFPARGGGPTIRGWLVRASAARIGPIVIVVHGLNSCIRDDRVLLAGGMLHRHGFGVLFIDLRNHGSSDRDDGRYAGGTKEYRDVLGAWDWLVAQGVPPERIGLLGESLGAATALIAMGEEPRVAAVWEDSGYADIEVAIRAELRRDHDPDWLVPAGLFAARLLGGVDLTGKSPLEATTKLDGRPIFIAHGAADERLSVQYAYDLAASVNAHGGHVEPWIVEGAGHTEAIVLRATEYEERLASFFGRAIGA